MAIRWTAAGLWVKWLLPVWGDTASSGREDPGTPPVLTGGRLWWRRGQTARREADDADEGVAGIRDDNPAPMRVAGRLDCIPIGSGRRKTDAPGFEPGAVRRTGWPAFEGASRELAPVQAGRSGCSAGLNYASGAAYRLPPPKFSGSFSVGWNPSVAVSHFRQRILVGPPGRSAWGATRTSRGQSGPTRPARQAVVPRSPAS